MPFRLRIVLLIGLVLLASMAAGGLVTGWQVRRALSEELGSALAGARQTAASAFEDLPQSDHPSRDLRQLVATFDGNRHVRASLVGTDGRVLWYSRNDESGHPPPRWFRRLIEARPAETEAMLPVPMTRTGPATLILTPAPGLDMRAAWDEFRSLALVLAVSAGTGLLLVWLVIGAAFKPLALLDLRFRQIGAGDYSGRLDEAGPPELAQLQRGFNRMAGELETTTARNRQLSEQLARLQEEERVDIARDLHDEIGPHLFAVNLDAEMIVHLAETGRHDEIPGRVREIQGAVHHMQRQVRDLLGRLRPAQAIEFGLVAAIDDLVRFWAARQPDIAFTIALPDAEIPENTAEVAWRVVQEAVNNAVRHGRPRAIRIGVGMEEGGMLGVTVHDDGSSKAASGDGGAAGTGLGLIGMRERVVAEGGTLIYGPAKPGGWTVAAHLPLKQGTRA